MTRSGTWCCFIVPHLGGTFTVYRALRSGLEDRGIAVRWMAAGADAHRALADPRHAGEAAWGEAVGRPDDDARRLAAAMLARLEEGGFDGVFVNVLSDVVPTNLVRHLPSRIRRVMIVHNVTPGTYAAARAIRDHVDATVGVSERIRRDLVQRHGFDPARTHAVANAPALPDPLPDRPPRPPGRLRALFVGRVEDQSKGVLWLPDILRMAGPAVELSVAGDGPDLPRLQRLCAPLGERVEFLGPRSPADVPSLLARHDVLLMPSRFEGFGLVLAEAMAMGCVPIASLLRGVTDTIVTDGHDGILFPVGALSAAAGAVSGLAGDPGRLERMSGNARSSVALRFSMARMADGYAAVIDRAVREPSAKPPPLALADWSLPPGLRPGLRTFLPRPVKNLGRLVLERLM